MSVCPGGSAKQRRDEGREGGREGGKKGGREGARTAVEKGDDTGFRGLCGLYDIL